MIRIKEEEKKERGKGEEEEEGKNFKNLTYVRR